MLPSYQCPSNRLATKVNAPGLPQRNTGTSALGQKRTSARAMGLGPLSAKADVTRLSVDVIGA